MLGSVGSSSSLPMVTAVLPATWGHAQIVTCFHNSHHPLLPSSLFLCLSHFCFSLSFSVPHPHPVGPGEQGDHLRYLEFNVCGNQHVFSYYPIPPKFQYCIMLLVWWKRAHMCSQLHLWLRPQHSVSQAEETLFLHWFKMCFHEHKGKQTMIPYALFYDFMQIYGISGTPCLNFACLSWLRDLIIICNIFPWKLGSLFQTHNL